jgi:hypothetical protein
MLLRWLAIVVGITLVVGCGPSDKRGDEVIAMIDSVWEAAGVDDEIVDVFLYRDTWARSRTDCAHLDRDDRWYGEQASSVPPGHLAQSSAEDAIARFLAAEGFSVERYRAIRSDNHVRRYLAVLDEMVVYGTLSADGATTVHVRSGPCAPFTTGFDPAVYEIDDDS